MQKNPYLILGVDENVTFAELQDAYNTLQNKYKADRFLEGEAGAEAIKKLEEVEWAYSECQRIMQEKATVNESSKIYEDISSLIKEDKLVEAQSKLDSIDSRDAEWHYYQSIVYYKKKWLSDSKTQLEICVSLDPKNYKYAEALRKLNEDMANSDPFNGNGANANAQYNQSQQNRGGYTEPQMNTQRNTDACCNTCCALMCCDTCCECCGGDFIACC
ncbi:MAG: hypothetical protein K2P12_03135 [Clostridia bacterium]|nr:hypothetical protein [Clostridia bacterium]